MAAMHKPLALLAVIAAVLLLAVPAAAQELSSEFSITLPAGTLLTPETAEVWDHEDNISFDWQSDDESSGIASIMGTIDAFEEEITEELFAGFMSGVDEGFAGEEQLKLVNTNDNDEVAGRVWASRLLAQSDGENEVFLETYSTYAGPNIYTITLVYPALPDEAVYTEVYEALASFETPYD
jgi:hypothetical protein